MVTCDSMLHYPLMCSQFNWSSKEWDVLVRFRYQSLMTTSIGLLIGESQRLTIGSGTVGNPVLLSMLGQPSPHQWMTQKACSCIQRFVCSTMVWNVQCLWHIMWQSRWSALSPLLHAYIFPMPSAAHCSASIRRHMTIINNPVLDGWVLLDSCLTWPINADSLCPHRTVVGRIKIQYPACP